MTSRSGSTRAFADAARSIGCPRSSRGFVSSITPWTTPSRSHSGATNIERVVEAPARCVAADVRPSSSHT